MISDESRSPSAEARIERLVADDGRDIRFAAWNANRDAPLLCLLQGRAETFELYERVVDRALKRGFAVAAFDWRGQGGSSRTLKNPLLGHVDDFAEYARDLDAVLRRLDRLAPRARRFALAHSMGATILLDAFMRERVAPDAFQRVALCAPALGMPPAPIPDALLGALLELGVACGAATRGVPASDAAFNPLKRTPRDNPYTADAIQFRRLRVLHEAAAEKRFAVRKPTWQWTRQFRRAAERIRRRLADSEALAAPPMIALVGEADRVAPLRRCESLLAERVERVVAVPRARHSLHLESDAALARCERELFDRFFTQPAR